MRYLVAGARVAGAASALALHRLGHEVVVVDREAADPRLVDAGIEVILGDVDPELLLSKVDEVVLSPGIPPHHPLAVAAIARGLDVYSEPELAWRLRGPDAPIWLGVTGTNGKTTTTTMLASMLRAAGLRSAALGNIGMPLVDAQTGFDVLAVELSSFQLHWSSMMAPQAGVVLNLADDHLDWHGGFDRYAEAKTAIWRGGLAIGNLDDPLVAAHLAHVPGRRIGFTLGVPPSGCVGLVEDLLIDRMEPAQGPHPADRRYRGSAKGELQGLGDAHELATISDVKPSGMHNVANALAAAALARSIGIPRQAIREGLVSYVPEPHRNAAVATVRAVSYVDDSKATNPHAALASLLSYDRVVWIAGGQLKGVDIEELVSRVAPRLVGAVVLGADRAQVLAALARHTPSLPVVEVSRTDDGAMGEVVKAAARLASPGDTVLLAPAAASLDMFKSYAARGDAFANAVHRLGS
jgi:UDP-N-acetylmuramoylalanine--D-glutamate ligase